MIISAKVIKKPRIKRVCESCHEMIEGAQLRLYGAADLADPPYVVYVHIGCGGGHPEVKKAFAAT